MPGWSNSDNKFGLSPFIVGTALGDGCNYTSIQAAINDAWLLGASVVYVRPGLYSENLTLHPKVEVIGSTIDGQSGTVNIAGAHSIIDSGSYLFRNIQFQSLGSTTFTATNVNPIAVVVCFNCNFDAGVSIFSTTGSTASFLGNGCTGSSAGDSFDMQTDGAITLFDSNISSNSSVVNTASTNNILFENCELAAANYIIKGSSANFSADIQYSVLSSSDEIVTFNIPGGTLSATHSTFNCNAGSGFCITGTGTFTYSDLINGGISTVIDPAVTQQKLSWQPYAESGAAPGAGVPRGTSCFDSTQFSVTDGFVQVNLNNLFPWNDVAISGPVNSFNGYISTAAVTLTLPAAPAQGDVIKFKADSALNLVVQANIGQQIRVGSAITAIAGSIVSTAIGDAIELTYRAATATWIANSMIGNWTV